MKSKFNLTIALAAFMMMGILYSCENKKKETPLEKAQTELDKLNDNLEDITADDPNFSDKVNKELDKFDEKMEDIKESMNEAGSNANSQMKDAVNDIQEEGRKVRIKVKSWGERTGDNIEEFGEDIKKEFNDLKKSLKKDRK